MAMRPNARPVATALRMRPVMSDGSSAATAINPRPAHTLQRNASLGTNERSRPTANTAARSWGTTSNTMNNMMTGTVDVSSHHGHSIGSQEGGMDAHFRTISTAKPSSNAPRNV